MAPGSCVPLMGPGWLAIWVSALVCSEADPVRLAWRGMGDHGRLDSCNAAAAVAAVMLLPGRPDLVVSALSFLLMAGSVLSRRTLLRWARQHPLHHAGVVTDQMSPV